MYTPPLKRDHIYSRGTLIAAKVRFRTVLRHISEKPALSN